MTLKRLYKRQRASNLRMHYILGFFMEASSFFQSEKLNCEKMATPRNTFCAIVIDAPMVEFVKSDGSSVFRFPKIYLPCPPQTFKKKPSLPTASQCVPYFQPKSQLRALLEKNNNKNLTVPWKSTCEKLEGEYIFF
jgi:hypothetical protein